MRSPDDVRLFIIETSLISVFLASQARALRYQPTMSVKLQLLLLYTVPDRIATSSWICKPVQGLIWFPGIEPSELDLV